MIINNMPNKFYLLIILVHLVIISSQYINIDIENFDKEIFSSKEISLIEFYSERCSTCQEFSPIWDNLMQKLPHIKIGRVNIDHQKGMNLAQRLNALNNGIPCIKIFYGQDKNEDIMNGTEDPFPSIEQLKARIDKVLKKLGKFIEGKYIINEEL